jgi:hypothetical protein
MHTLREKSMKYSHSAGKISRMADSRIEVVSSAFQVGRGGCSSP